MMRCNLTRGGSSQGSVATVAWAIPSALVLFGVGCTGEDKPSKSAADATVTPAVETPPTRFAEVFGDGQAPAALAAKPSFSEPDLMHEAQRLSDQIAAQSTHLSRLIDETTALQAKLRAAEDELTGAMRRTDWVDADRHSAQRERLATLQAGFSRFVRIAADYTTDLDRANGLIVNVRNPAYRQRLEGLVKIKLLDRQEFHLREHELAEVATILGAVRGEAVSDLLEATARRASLQVFTYDGNAVDASLRELSARLGPKLTFAQDQTAILGDLLAELERVASAAPPATPATSAPSSSPSERERSQLWDTLEREAKANARKDTAFEVADNMLWMLRDRSKKDVCGTFYEAKRDNKVSWFRDNLVLWLVPKHGRRVTPEAPHVWDEKWARMLDQADSLGYSRDEAGVKRFVVDKVYPALWHNVEVLYEEGFWK